MATVVLLSDEEAAPEARALAHDPALLRATWDRLKAVTGPGELDPVVKEMTGLGVEVDEVSEA